MAFGDSNDIKINVTVDTADAIKAAKDLEQAFQNVSKTIGADFKTIASISKDFTTTRLAQINAANSEELARIRGKTEEQIAAIKKDVDAFKQGEISKRDAAKNTNDTIAQLLKTLTSIQQQAEATKRQELQNTQKIEKQLIEESAKIVKGSEDTKRADIKATMMAAVNSAKEETKQFKINALERVALANVQSQNYKVQLKKDLDVFVESEKTKRSQNQLTLEQLRIEAAKVRQETARIQKGFGDVGGSGKIFEGLKGAFLGASIGIGPLTVGVGTLASTLGTGGLLIGAIGVATGALISFGRTAFQTLGQLAEGGNRVQGLATAFSTLQQSLARDPAVSIQKLREATQGLISDTELYQKANQAVLLGVPAPLFEKSAEAAVKLGRAMGIDARLALESLSIGLGRQSRLYLDNLGIVVSATEAYRKFAQEVGKSADDLTDAEKRQAFFNETSQKLQEGLARLPAIQDDVGIAYTKLNTLTENANDAFLRSFNNTNVLSSALGDFRNRINNELIPTFKNLGESVGIVFAAIASAAEAIIPPVVRKLGELAEAFNRAFGNQPENQLKRTKDKLKELRDELANVDAEIAKGGPQPLIDNLNKQAQALQLQILGFEGLKSKLSEEVSKQGEGGIQIPLRIDNEGILSDISSTETLVTNLVQSIQEQTGLIKIPGLNVEEIKKFQPEIDSVFKSIESGALKGEAAGAAVEAVVKKITTAVGEVNRKVTENQLIKAKAKLATQPDNAEVKLEIATLEQRLKIQKENIQVDEKQRAQIAKIVQERQKLAKADIQQGKKATTEASNELKKRQNEIEQFLLSVRRKTQTAISPKFEKQLAELFRTANPESEEFQQRLKAIAEEAQKAKEDLKTLADAAKAFQDAIQAGVPKEQLADTASGAKQQKISLEEANAEIEKSKEEFARTMKQIGVQAASDLATGFAETIASGKGLGGPETAKQITSAFGAVFGGAVGYAIGGPLGAQVGAGIGSTLMSSIVKTAKKSNVYKAFEEIFDSGAISLVVNKQIEDAAGNISIEPIAEAIRNPAGLSGGIAGIVNQAILAYSPQGVFANLSDELKAQFEAVATSLGSVFGDSLQDIQVLTAVLAENTGGSLQNLQVIIQATGKSFDEFATAIYDAMLKGVISKEVIGEFGRSIGLTAEQLPLLFASLKYLGINTLEDLAKAGDNVLITFAEQLRRIKEGVATTITDVKIPIAPAPQKQIAPSGPSPAEKQRELLKKQVEEARNLLLESQKYANVLSTITKSKASQVAAGKQISELEKEILKQIKARDSAEKSLNAELDRGAKANAANVAKYSAALDKAKRKLEELGATAGDTTRIYKDLDISAIIPLIQSQNSLGVVARAVGVDLQKNIDILIKGFLQGKLSIAKVNEEINKTKGLLGPGIPEAIGAVSEAFTNLQNAGLQGGQFSVDAFRDIFAEFRERFKTEGSALAEQQRKTLLANFDAARAALDNAVGPEETARARKVFEQAKKA
ncbi:hypothetical protein EBT16_02380, partial [bacterium]|nr:hypothetical protein [bacterium]